MNAKHYVSLEIANMLKEKGFNESCIVLWDEEFEELIPASSICSYKNQNHPNGYCSAPTLLEAMDWLERKDLRISARYDWIKYGWYYVITNGLPTIQNITEVETSDNIFYRDRNECMQKAIEMALTLLTN